jgi:glutamate transport system permease protein
VSVLIDQFDLILRGFWMTLRLTGFAAAIALVVGTVLAAMRVSPAPPLRGAATTYVEIVRNTPLTLVFVLMVFGLPELGFRFSFFIRAVISLSVYTSAFVCEVLRSGINAVQSGQAEAARALGMTFGQTLQTIVLPQAFRTVIPPLGNLLIALTKNTAIAEAFGVIEATGTFDNLVRDFPGSFWPLFLGTAFGYVVIVLAISGVLRLVERRVVVLR